MNRFGSVPDRPNGPDDGADDGFESKKKSDGSDPANLIIKLLEGIHGPGNFDVSIHTHEKITVAHARDSEGMHLKPTVRPEIAQDFNTITEFIALAERLPEIGSIQTIVIAGQQVQFKFDGVEGCLRIVESGFHTIRTGYGSLNESELEKLEQLTERAKKVGS